MKPFNILNHRLKLHILTSKLIFNLAPQYLFQAYSWEIRISWKKRWKERIVDNYLKEARESNIPYVFAYAWKIGKRRLKYFSYRDRWMGNKSIAKPCVKVVSWAGWVDCIVKYSLYGQLLFYWVFSWPLIKALTLTTQIRTLWNLAPKLIIIHLIHCSWYANFVS